MAVAARDSLRTVKEGFEPRFVFAARVQPALFGFPLGDPSAEVEFAIDKDSLSFAVSGSVIETLKQSVDLPTGGFGSGLIGLATLGAEDRLGFAVSVPLPEMDDILFPASPGKETKLPPLDPDTDGRDWAVEIEGGLSIAGLTAEVGGFITRPDNATFVDQQIEQRYELPSDAPVSPGKAQILTDKDYDNIIRFGGVVVFGRMGVPRLITDPVDTIRDIGPFPADPFDILDWFGDLGDTITSEESPLYASAFFPIPIDTFGLDADAAKKAETEWIEAAWLTGVLDGTAPNADTPRVARLLSIPVGTGTIRLAATGLEVTTGIPLLGATGRFTMRAENVGTVGAPVVAPAAGLEIEVSAAEASTAFTELGLPDLLQVVGGNANVEVRAFTPGFDPEAEPTDLARRGGLQIAVDVDLPRISGARAFLDIDPVGTGFGPDVTARIAVDEIGPFFGLSVELDEFSISKIGGDASLVLDGRALLDIPGSTPPVEFASIEGELSTEDGLMLRAVIGNDDPLELNGFQIRGSVTAELSPTTAELTVDGRVAIPGLITNARASGAIDGSGLRSLAVSVGSFGPAALRFVDNQASIEHQPNGSYLFDIAGSIEIGTIRGPGGDPIAYSGSVDSDGTIRVDVNVPTMRLFGAEVSGSLKIRRLNVGTTANPRFVFRASGTVTGTLTIGGRELIDVSLRARVTNGVVEFATVDPAEVDLGFITAEMDGLVRSNGTFRVEGSIDSSFTVFGLAGWDADLDVRLDSTRGVSGSFSGEVFLGPLRGQMTASLRPTGRVDASIAADVNLDGRIAKFFNPITWREENERIEFHYQIGDPVAPDRTPPVFRPVDDIEIVTFVAGGRIPVNYRYRSRTTLSTARSSGAAARDQEASSSRRPIP